jgi:hypothetical protein
MTATFLVFLLCGQPAFVMLDTPQDTALYAVGEMTAEQRKAFLETMDGIVAEGRAKRLDFKVEDQAKGAVCGVST